MVNGGRQQLRIDTIDAITGVPTSANCRVINSTTDQTVKSSETIEIKRSSDHLTVDCEDDSSTGRLSQDSDFLQLYLLSDIATDLCIVSCFIDGTRGAWYAYPSPLIVKMHPHP